MGFSALWSVGNCWNSLLPVSIHESHIRTCQSQPSPMVHSVHHVRWEDSFVGWVSPTGICCIPWCILWCSLLCLATICILRLWVGFSPPLNGHYVSPWGTVASEMLGSLAWGLWRSTPLLLLIHFCSSRMDGCFLGILFLACGHPLNTWCFIWLSTGLACIAILTLSNWNFIAETSDVMCWTGTVSKSSLSAASGSNGMTWLRACAIMLSSSFRYVSSTSYFTSQNNSPWSWGLAATIEFFPVW